MAQMISSQLTPPQRLAIVHESSVAAARRLAVAMASSLEFEAQACEEIALAATELASNLVKHAHAGTVTVKQVNRNGRVGIEIETQDSGPGIADIEVAMRDGFSTKGSMGIGLGAVNRLMDEFDIHSEPSGTRIVCRKWVDQPAMISVNDSLAFGMATRPMKPGQPNGDAAIIKRWGGSALVGVIDGLGHGQFAHRAAMAAKHYVENHYDLPLTDIFRGTARACSATRGVVMALARIEPQESKLSFASVGDIEARLFPGPVSRSFIVRRGILGVNAPGPVVTEHNWNPNNLLVLHSDGLHSRWGWEEVSKLANEPAQQMAQQLLRTLSKERDDATIVVVKNKPS